MGKIRIKEITAQTAVSTLVHTSAQANYTTVNEKTETRAAGHVLSLVYTSTKYLLCTKCVFYTKLLFCTKFLFCTRHVSLEGFSLKNPRTPIYIDLSYIDPQARVLNYC